MDPSAAAATPAALAKAALRRLAQARLEPTPANYARAYAEEGGRDAPNDAAPEPDAQVLQAAERRTGQAWVGVVDRVARGLERGGRQWTSARRKDSLNRVLEGSRSDPQRLLQRLQSLLSAWETDQPADAAETGLDAGFTEPVATAATAQGGAWSSVVQALGGTVQQALPPHDDEAAALARRFGELAERLAAQGPEPEAVADVQQACEAARRVLGAGHRLVEQLLGLCREMSQGMGTLAEDDSWVQGQCAQLQAALEGPPSARSLRAVSHLLNQTQREQQRLGDERRAAREALKHLIRNMLAEVEELGQHTGRFEHAAERHAQQIAQASSLQELADVVRELLADTRAVHSAAGLTRERLQSGQAQAVQLETRVRELEAELRRMSEELSTDLLTQVANRRGLMQQFERESAAAARAGGAPLAVGLLDIDNFKRLNDTLGHAAGDQALKSLAAAVRERLRPGDHLARFGGEEFVVLLPATPRDEAQQALTRLQRGLTEALFLHEGREVFVTFSAGVTQWQAGEPLQAALERADAALYEAKRTGKNRTCVA